MAKRPEFAIYSPNLVPSRSPSNTRKRDKVVDEDTDVRLFLHPHFDGIPADSFLVADVLLAANAISLTFRLYRPAELAIRTFCHLRSHFEQLDLADRYRRIALEQLGGQYSRAQSSLRRWRRCRASVKGARECRRGFRTTLWGELLDRCALPLFGEQ